MPRSEDKITYNAYRLHKQIRTSNSYQRFGKLT